MLKISLGWLIGTKSIELSVPSLGITVGIFPPSALEKYINSQKVQWTSVK